MFSLYKHFVNHVTARGHLDDAKYQISRLKALWLQITFCFIFPYISNVKHVNLGRAIFIPRGIILTNLVEVNWIMLHTKYHGSRPGGFRHFFFFSVSRHVAIKLTGTIQASILLFFTPSIPRWGQKVKIFF